MWPDDKADSAEPIEEPVVTVPEPEEAAEESPPEEPVEEEVLPRVHQAAAPGTPVAPEGVSTEYFIGMWGEKPNYGCPYCPYATIEGSGAVELHILAKIDAGDFKHRQALVPKE